MWFKGAISAALMASIAQAHLVPFHKAMYCFNGTNPSNPNMNNQDPVTPLWMLSQKDWWFHHINGCDQFPPAPGDFLELPAGESFTVEIASNRGKTSLSFNGKFASDWPDGGNYPEDYSMSNPGPTLFKNSPCIPAPNMHTQNQSMAAGTAFAISYESDFSKVTPQNLAVFTVRYNTPWKRLTTYDVPKAMPACPEEGCICAWGWVPNGCGEPNIYMAGYRCKVTGATSTVAVAAPKPPVWCQNDQSKCVKGSKQLIYWNQAEGNNINVTGWDLSGAPKSPAYNGKLGWADGAQDDIFESSGSSAPPPPPAQPSSSASKPPHSSTVSSAAPSHSPSSSVQIHTSVTPHSSSSLAPSPPASSGGSCKAKAKRSTKKSKHSKKSSWGSRHGSN